MSTKQIERLVAQAIALDRQIQTDTETLKGLKADLVVLAEAEPAERREETKEGGYSVVYTCGDGAIARVTQPAARLKSSIDAETTAGAKLKERVGRAWSDLFEARIQWIPVANFRDVVAEKFKPSDAKAILKACTTASAAKVSFETKEAA